MADVNNNRIYIFDGSDGLVIDDKRLTGRCLVVINKGILPFPQGHKRVLVEAFSRAIGYGQPAPKYSPVTQKRDRDDGKPPWK